MAQFNVTYELTTNESAADGDAAERGFIGQDVSLREAFGLVLETRTSHCERSCIQADEWPIRAPRWITVMNGADWIEGIAEDRALHIPENATDATRRRIARLFGLKVEARP